MAEQNNAKGGQAKEQDVNQLLKVRREKLAALQEAGKDPFVITKYDQTHHTTDAKALYEEHEAKILGDRKAPDTTGLSEEEARDVINNDYNERRAIMDAQPIHVSIAGRMLFKRVMGKASFCNIQDRDGRIQVYVAKDAIGEDSYADFKKSDIGDIFGIKGYVFRTKTGEISIHAEEITLLSKSLQILPEKFHGLTDTDMRYRQRYVDLIMNQESKEVFIKRSKIIKEIRNFLADRDFMEVETPMLVANAGGAAARPFETHYNALDEDVKLRISLELYLKRLIVGGLERVYEIGRVFRNEGVDTRHNPEFTLMELYQAYTDYEGMMELTESMFRYLAEKVCGSTKISYNGIEIDLGKPFERLTMNDAIKKYTGIDFDTVSSDEEAKALDETPIDSLVNGKDIFQKLIAPYRGRVIYVDFWGTWCGPCQREMEHLPQLHEALKELPVTYIYFANKSPEELWQKATKRFGLGGSDCLNLRLPDSQQCAVEDYVGVQGFPTYVLVAPDGTIVTNKAPRPSEASNVREAILKLIEK